MRRETLAHLAESLSIGDYLYLGQGEERSGGRHRQSNLSSALEAIIGAVLIDQGFITAKELVLRLLSTVSEKAIAEDEIKDYKSLLQELAQAERRITPTYRLIAEEGPAHDKAVSYTHLTLPTN